MKKFCFFISIFLPLFFISCGKDAELFIQEDIHLAYDYSKEFEKVQSDITELDKRYSKTLIPVNSNKSNGRIRMMPGADTIMSIVCDDVMGAGRGVMIAYMLGITHPVAVGVFAGVCGGIMSYAKYQDYTDDILMSNIQLSQLNNFRTLDLRQPINLLAPSTTYNTDIVGKNVGPLHNTAILGICMSGDLTPNTNLGRQMIFDYVAHSVALNEDILSYSDIADDLSHLYENFHSMEEPLVLNNQFSEELEIIDHVYEVSLNLDSVTLFDYTNQVMEIVHDAYVHELISDSSAWLINASVSTLAHTRLLWKSYLPDYRLTTMYFAYIADFDKWVLCNRAQLQELSNTYHVTCTGIPGIVGGKCTEIFFFPSSSTYYNVSNINYSQPIQNSYFQLSNNVSFERMIPVYSNRLFEHMESGYYHVRNVPNENGITYVSFLEP